MFTVFTHVHVRTFTDISDHMTVYDDECVLCNTKHWWKALSINTLSNLQQNKINKLTVYYLKSQALIS